MQGGFLEQKPRSPGSLAIVIMLHAAAITALAVSKMDMPVKTFTPIRIKDVPETPPPPENPPERNKDEARPAERVDRVPQQVPDLPRNDVIIVPQRDLPIVEPGPAAGSGGRAVDPLPVPRADPVRIAARIDPASRLQPPYPPSEERMGSEGSVTVRVTIGADGRVKAVERISSTSDAFFRATERHALRHWKFRPETLDGRPVESSRLMTVKFQLAA